MMQPCCILAERRLLLGASEGATHILFQLPMGCIHTLKSFPGSHPCPATAPGVAEPHSSVRESNVNFRNKTHSLFSVFSNLQGGKLWIVQ